MKNNKGQALIEFTLILPVILLILLYIVEFGRITLKKYQLESDIDLVTTLYQEKKLDELNNYINKNNLTINYKTENNLTTIELKQNIKSNMPLLNNILGNNINTKRTIYDPVE